jgi:hypothetical protein
MEGFTAWAELISTGYTVELGWILLTVLTSNDVLTLSPSHGNSV